MSAHSCRDRGSWEGEWSSCVRAGAKKKFKGPNRDRRRRRRQCGLTSSNRGSGQVGEPERVTMVIDAGKKSVTLSTFQAMHGLSHFVYHTKMLGWLGLIGLNYVVIYLMLITGRKTYLS